MDPQDRFVKVRECRFHYIEWPDNGPDLLFYHGDQRSSGSFRAVGRRVADRFHTFAIDGRGAGDTWWTRRGYTMPERADDFIALAEAAGWRDILAVGHSIGATVLLYAARKRPDLFAGFFLLDPIIKRDFKTQERVSQAPIRSHRYWPSRDEMRQTLLHHPTAGKWAREVIEDVVQHEALEHPNGQVEVKWAPEMFNYADRTADDFDLTEDVRRLGKPIAVLVGTEQTAVDVPHVRACLAPIPGAQLVLCQGAGHNVYMEWPDVTAQLLTAFAEGKRLPETVGKGTGVGV